MIRLLDYFIHMYIMIYETNLFSDYVKHIIIFHLYRYFSALITSLVHFSLFLHLTYIYLSDLYTGRKLRLARSFLIIPDIKLFLNFALKNAVISAHVVTCLRYLFLGTF